MSDPEDRSERNGPAESPESPDASSGPGRLRRWVLRPLIWLGIVAALAAAVLYFAVQSEPVRQRIEHLVEERLSAYLDRSVTVDRLEIQPFFLTARATGITIPSDDLGEPPLVAADWVEVELDVTDLWWSSILRVDRIEMERPRIFLELYEDGGTNLPELPTGDGRDGELEVILDHLLVHDGVVQIEERRLPLSVDARQVRGRLTGGGGTEASDVFRVRGSARAVEVVLPNAEPYTVSLDVEGRMEPGRLELTDVRIAEDALLSTARGTISWGEEQAVELTVDAVAQSSLVNELGWMEEPLSGEVRFDGGVTWTPEDWGWQGRVRSEGIDTFDRRFEAVTARVRGGPDEVTVDIEGARHAGGGLTGTVVVEMESLPSGARRVRLDARGRDLHLRRLLDDLDLPLQGLAGRVDADLAYAFSSDGILEGDGSGEVRVAKLRRPTDRLEITGRSDLGLEDGVLRFQNAVLDAEDQHVEADASFDLTGKTGRVEYRVQTRDLERLFLLAPGAEEAGAEPAAWVPRRGGGSLEGTLLTGPEGVSTDVVFDLTDVAIPGFAVDTLEGSLRYGNDGLRDLDVTAGAGDGRLVLTGSVGLPGPVGLALDFRSWPSRTLEGLLPGDMSARGDLFGELALTGDFENLAFEGSARAVPLEVAGFEFDRAEAGFRYADGILTLDPLDLFVPAGGATVSGTLDFEAQTLNLSVETGELALDRPPLGNRLTGDLAGVLEATAQLTGSFENPDGRIRLTARELTLSDRPLGDGVAQMEMDLSGGRLEARGSLLELVDFEGGGAFDGQAVDLSFQVESSRLRRLMDLVTESPPPVEGSFAGVLTVTGELERPTETLQARLELSSLQLQYEDREIENIDPVVAELTSEALFLRSVFLGDPASQSELFLGGRIDLEESFPLDLQVQATLGAAWAELALADVDVELDGRFDLLATIRGTLASPELNGQGEVRQGRLILPDFPHSLDQISAVVLLYPDQVVLDSLRGQMAGGRVQGAGRLDLPKAGEPLRYRLQARAENLGLRWPEGWLIRGGAEITLEAPVGEGRELRGVVTLERAFYLRDVEVGFLSLTQRMFQRERLAVRETDEMLASTQLALSVEGENALRIRNNLADLTGDVDLIVRGNLARPVVFGQVEVDPGGTLVLRDTEYTVERGLLTFSNPYRLDPVLDLVASTEVSSYDVQLNATGTLDNLRTSFQSDPPLADLEVLQLLATGSARGLGRGAEPSGEGPGFAEQFLFGQATSAISERVTSLFGFDKFQISPGVGGDSSAVGVAVEKRITDDLYVAYTSQATESEEDLLQIGWEVTDQLTLVFSREGDDDLILEVRWEKAF